MFIDMTKQQFIKPYSFREMGLKKHKSKYSNFDLITFDIETWGLNPQNLALAVFFDGVNYVIEYDKKGVMTYLESLENDSLIYAHNGAKYDFIIFFDEIIGNRFKFNKVGEIILIEFINKKGKKIIFKDSVYIFNQPLKALAKSFGGGEYKGVTPQKFINPYTINFNREEFERNRKEYNLKNVDLVDVEYCKQDCKVLFNILNNDEVKKLNIREYNTIGKIANSKMFEYIENEIGCIEIDDSIDSQFKNLYSGGLTDVFKHKSENKILTLDVNSMYPFSMVQEFPNPIEVESFYFEHTIEEHKSIFWDMLKNYPNGKSVVTIRLKEGTDERIIKILKTTPLIPNYKTAYNDYFDFRVYKIEIMNVELANLLNPILKNCFEIIPLTSHFCRKENLFKPFANFIDDTYNKRLEARENKRTAEVQSLKIIMNSSYGYLAMQVQNIEYKILNETNMGFYLYERTKELINSQDLKNIYEFMADVGNVIENEFNGLDTTITRADIFDYVNYLKENIGDDEDFQIIGFEEIEIDNSPISKYLVVTRGRKCQTDRTSFILASEITAKSRAYLGYLSLLVRDSGNEICYCDTDSLHIEVIQREALFKALEGVMDDKRLGGLKDEGEYDLGYWFAKKHYYLFKKKGNDYILEKNALKGFPVAKPIDSLIHERNIVNVSKMASRVKFVSFNSNVVTVSKSFLNFTVSRMENGEFFPIPRTFGEEEKEEIDIIRDINIHKKSLIELYKSLINRKDILIPDGEEYTRLSEKAIENRINEINLDLAKNAHIGVYESERSMYLIPNRIEKELSNLKEFDKPRFWRRKYQDLTEEKKASKLTRSKKREIEREERKSEMKKRLFE